MSKSFYLTYETLGLVNFLNIKVRETPLSPLISDYGDVSGAGGSNVTFMVDPDFVFVPGEIL